MGFIYKITNTINGKSYVGVTKQVNAIMRFKAHMSAIRGGRGCPLLAKAVKKYGENAFIFEILFTCKDSDIFTFEKEYILKYNSMSPNGYNIAEGGKSGRNFLGKTHTKEVRTIIGEKSKIYNNLPEVKERHRQNAIKLNERKKNGDLTDKWKQQIIDGKIGGKGKKRESVPEERRQSISEGLKKYYEKKNKNIKIYQYSTDGILISVFNSIKEASEKNTLKQSGIYACCSGRNKTSGGYIWKKEPKECHV